MELYSKEELLKELKKEYSCGGECDYCPEVLDAGSCSVLRCIRRIIDNAPTVDTYTIEDIQEVRENALILGAKLAQRPQGEWIKQHGKSYMMVTDEGSFVGEFTKCPKCLYDKARGSKFCPNCGTKMKRGKEE